MNSLSNFNIQQSGWSEGGEAIHHFAGRAGRSQDVGLLVESLRSVDRNVSTAHVARGLKLTLYLKSGSDVLYYDPTSEATWDTVMESVEFPTGKTYGTMTNDERILALQGGLMRFTGKGVPSAAAPLTDVYGVIADFSRNDFVV